MTGNDSFSGDCANDEWMGKQAVKGVSKKSTSTNRRRIENLCPFLGSVCGGIIIACAGKPKTAAKISTELLECVGPVFFEAQEARGV